MVSDITGGADRHTCRTRASEADENDLVVRNDQFLALGLKPTELSYGLLDEVVRVAQKYRSRVDPSKIISRSVWREGMETAEVIPGIADYPGN